MLVAEATMDMVDRFDAGNRFDTLIGQVDRAQEVIITRHGKPVGRLVPVAHEVNRAADAVARADALRESIAERGKSFTREDLASYRDEGRR
jgi:prevent-host-death family protein